jgi:hypothetical protein
VAGLALVTRGLFEQAVVKLALPGKTLHPGVVAVAGHAVLAAQFLVESGAGAGLENDSARGGPPTNVCRLVATDTFLGAGTGECGMAGKTVSFKRFVTGNQ